MSFNIASAIDSVLVVDDKFEDVEKLIEELSKKSIQAEYINPTEIESVEVKCGNTLIVLDFELLESVGHKSNINKIRDVLSKVTNDLKVYGIAFWSKHSEENFDDDDTKKLFDVLKSDIDKDIEDGTLANPPLYYVTILDKLSYIDGTHQWNEFFDHFKTSLETSKSAMYYFRWSYLMKDAVYDTFGKINHILADYKYSDRDSILAFLLYHLSKVHIGYEENDTTKLANHSFRAVAGVLEDAIKEKADSIQDCQILQDYRNTFTVKSILDIDVSVTVNTKGEILNNPSLLKTIGQLNAIYAFDFNAEYARDLFMPGNVYKVPEGFSSCLESEFDGQVKVLLEITPPCDFAQGRCTQPKFLEGVFCNIDIAKNKKGAKYYNFLHPIFYNGQAYYFILDFNTMYMGNIADSRTNFIGRANDGLFADILQKYSSHISRLGVSFINNIKY